MDERQASEKKYDPFINKESKLVEVCGQYALTL